MKRTKLLKHHCKFQREGGNHTIYTNSNETRKTSIPRHPEIKPNTVRKVCKDLDIPAPGEK